MVAVLLYLGNNFFPPGLFPFPSYFLHHIIAYEWRVSDLVEREKKLIPPPSPSSPLFSTLVAS